MSHFQPKLVDTFRYHLWTDALHLRAIAHQARNRWDRGTYARCTLTNAWTALEMACNDALEVTDIGYRFCEHLNRAIANKGLPKLDWSKGLWHDVRHLQSLRKQFVHAGISEGNRFAEASLADQAIRVCRGAIKAIYAHAGKAAQAWVDDDSDTGFDKRQTVFAYSQNIKQGADHPDTIRVTFVYKDEEHICEYHPAGTDCDPLLDDLIRRTQLPISAVRVYRGSELLKERDLLMRGN